MFEAIPCHLLAYHDSCCAKCQVTIRCCKMETDVTAEDEDRFGRRDVLKCFGVTIGMVRTFLYLLKHKLCFSNFTF